MAVVLTAAEEAGGAALAVDMEAATVQAGARAEERVVATGVGTGTGKRPAVRLAEDRRRSLEKACNGQIGPLEKTGGQFGSAAGPSACLSSARNYLMT